ncbi:uncharacterized protein [Amphiura filiformis]|uniref:uncharacterized protein n=1 Tax=Amphiura filiformis TaxID=82378 RepID=UPI003B2198DA
MRSCNGCIVGWPIEDRGGPDSSGWTIVSPDQPFLCSGHVITWTYQGKFSGAFRAIVFRPTEGSVTEFQIVGINNIPAGAVNTPVTYTVPVNERIAVRAGDVIGWSFGDGVITYNNGGNYSVRWVSENLPASLEVNQIVDFNYGVKPREYSIEATVTDNEKPVLESCPANQTTNATSGTWTATIVWHEPTATDNSGNLPTVICDPPSGNDFAIGQTPVTCTASDRSRNSETCSFYIDVVIDNCQHQLGMEDGRIQDGQIRASSQVNGDQGAQNARLRNAKHWCASQRNGNQWIQVDLRAVMWVSGVMIQGRAIYAHWVTKFKVLYGIDGLEWMYIQVPYTQTHMVFDGTSDHNTVHTRLFPSPVRAAFLRIHAIEWHNLICMRFDLIGCGGEQKLI